MVKVISIFYGIIGIMTVSGQQCAVLFPDPTSCVCTPSPTPTPYTCDETAINGEPCVEFASLCAACSKACSLGSLLNPPQPADIIFPILACSDTPGIKVPLF